MPVLVHNFILDCLKLIPTSHCLTDGFKLLHSHNKETSLPFSGKLYKFDFQ